MRYIRKKLGEIAQISSGGTPSRSNHEYWKNGTVPWVKISDFKGKFIEKTEEKITESGLLNSSAKMFDKGTILYSIFATIGEVSILNIPATTNQAIAGINVDNSQAENGYIYYWLKSIKNQVVNESRGVAQNNINLSILKSFEVPLIEIELQKKIVTILDKAQTLIQQRKMAIAKLDELVQVVFLDMFGDPVTNSKNLNTISLGELGEWKSGGTPSRGNKEYFKGNIPWYTSGELNDLYTNDSIEYITEAALKETSTKEVPIGALLLGMYDTAALKSSITTKRSSCNQAIAFAKIDENLAETKYVYYAVQIGKEHYKSIQRGVRQKNLNLSMIKAIKILYPSLELQKDFVKIADIIYLKKQQMNTQLQQLESNFQALLQKAFKGELTVKDGVAV